MIQPAPVLVDSHCHLDSPKFDADREEVILRARRNGVQWMVAIGTGDGPPDFEAGIRLAETYPFIYATVGVHPHDSAKASAENWAELMALAAHPKVVAVGEIGLDYHYDFSPPDIQRAAFQRQMQIARELGKPIVIHTREAWEETVAMIRGEYGATEAEGIFHCFSGGPAEAETALGLGFLISYSGIVTFPTAGALREAVRLTPLDRLLVETDAPYLAPAPHRGKRNEPSFVVETARRIAEVKGVSFETVAEASTANWKCLCLRETGGTR